MTDMDDDALLDALGVQTAPPAAASRTPQEERLIAGFEDILRFHAAQGRAPRHGTEGDIFERLYAVRLDALRQLPQARALLAPLDAPGLLAAGAPDAAALDEDALLAQLGVDAQARAAAEAGARDLTLLRHVRSSAQRNAAQEVAERAPCVDFEAQFAPLFERAERELKSGGRPALRFGRDASIAVGDFFILGGQMAYVAAMDEPYRTPNNEMNARLRVIYANGTESGLLLRSLQRALYKDSTGRRLGPSANEADPGPLFGESAEAGDVGTGTIYVLRSLSEHPFIAQHRELVHKIGVTGGRIEERIARAARDATYLLADVQVVASYQLHNIHRVRLENLLHRVFQPAQLDLEIADRFGQPVRPREWFLLPLAVIDEAVQRVRDGSITRMVYDPAQARLVDADGAGTPSAQGA